LVIAIIVIVVVVVLGFIVMSMYNGLVKARLRVREAYSGIDVQLKRRLSLIPNLVETVKGYASHERETLENVTRARAALQSAGTPGEAAQANNFLTQTLRSLFAVSEAYPDLKANTNFLELQRELTDTEDKIGYARQFYNSNVLAYNEKTSTFPTVLLANTFGFQPEQFFEAEAEAREDVQVSFGANTPGAAPAAAPPAAPPAAPGPPTAP
jgi:LemA protein